MTYYFCTYFDRHYLPRGLALYASLQQHCPQFKLWALCMDRPSAEILEQAQLPNLEIVPLEDLERYDRELLATKTNRNTLEYYFTCTPALPRYILDNWSFVDRITYLDSDLFFFSDPRPIFDEIGENSTAIIEHRYPEYLRPELEPYGIYNVGWVTFRRDQAGQQCLDWWRERCLEWCYDRYEDGKHGDQKYLDEWPSLFDKVIVLQHKGANLAPWNLMNYRYKLRGGQVYVDEDPLIFFHFTRFKQLREWLYDTHTARFRTHPPHIVRRHIYAPYIRTLHPIVERHPLSTGVRNPKGRYSFIQKIQKTPRLAHYLQGILRGQYMLYLRETSL